MEKIVPFKKNIDFEDNIYEITSISLEHSLTLKEENLISGSFMVSGTYKRTEINNPLDFEYELPFEIRIDKKYDTTNVKADINNFYYETVDSKILSVNIDVILENLEEKEEIMEEDRQIITEEPREIINEESEEQEDSLFKDLDDNEKYVTYKVHVITENDTKESISQKYEITISDLEKYNSLNDLKIGDKIIIPSNE